MINTGWKKRKFIDIGDACHTLFSDEYGYFDLSRFEILIKITNQIEKNINELYCFDEKQNGYVQISKKQLSSLEKIELALSKNIYIVKANTVNPYRYHYDFLQGYEVEKPNYCVVYLSLRFEKRRLNDSSYNEHADLKTKISSIKDLESLTCWQYCENDGRAFSVVPFSELTVSEKYYLDGVGIVTVKDLLKYPNPKNQLCSVIDANGSHRVLTTDSYDLYYLPYANVPDGLSELNNSLNELALSPYVINANGVFNIHWQPVNDASRYFVIAYRLIKKPGRKNVYHMADYEVDRNTHFLSISGLVGDNIIFKLKAEDRNGQIIAETRCISSEFDTKLLK